MAQQFSRWDKTGVINIDFPTFKSWLNLFYRPSAPNPPEYNTPEDIPIPVDIAPHFEEPIEDELNCLVMNITTPTLGSDSGAKLPVMVYIHGGSFLFGGAHKGVFDCVNLTTYAAARNTPVVTVNLNYRVGLGGFLASAAIKEDIKRDGLEGVGNFGLYDQQVALHWVNHYIASFGGDAYSRCLIATKTSQQGTDTGT
jgi:carboxylesterase type B